MTEREWIIGQYANDMPLKVARHYQGPDVADIPLLCRLITKCIGSIDYDHSRIQFPFAFVLASTDRQDSSVSFILNPAGLAQTILQSCSDSKNLLELDFEGRLLKIIDTASFSSLTDAVDYSKQTKKLVFFVVGRSVHVIVDGYCADYIPNVSHYKPTGQRNGREMHIDEWKKILANYEQAFKGEKRFFYWATPKADGLLKAKPEKLFRKDLANYIKDNTLGCFVDEEAFNDSTDDKTDIRATTTIKKEVYYFELKCLGRCESGTNYEVDHALEGLSQTDTYVKTDANSVQGILVVFDARKPAQAIGVPPELLKVLDAKVAIPPKQYHLDPTSASAAAKKLIGKLKKSKKGGS